jgi:hypothetical protein
MQDKSQARLWTSNREPSQTIHLNASRQALLCARLNNQSEDVMADEPIPTPVPGGMVEKYAQKHPTLRQVGQAFAEGYADMFNGFKDAAIDSGNDYIPGQEAVAKELAKLTAELIHTEGSPDGNKFRGNLLAKQLEQDSRDQDKDGQSR